LSQPPRLVVTADDFGAALAVNEAVERAHRTGILTAASLMVGGAAAEDAVERARTMPELGVGLHIVLADGAPTLPPDQLSALVGPDGQFHTSMLRTALTIAFSPAARAQMRAEVAAQFAAFVATGLRLDHVNAHKHFHLHPMIASAIIAQAKRHGLRAIRMPAQAKGGLLAWWARLLARHWRAQGMVTNDRVIGLAETGAFTPQRMQAALQSLPAGLTELYTHPATANAYGGSASGYLYTEELAALTDPLVLELARAIERGPFARFAIEAGA
jgi:hopanoid biosynthesis associated protein HpnK